MAASIESPRPVWLRLVRAIPAFLTAVVVAIVVYANWRDAHREITPAPRPIGVPGGTRTSRDGLQQTIDQMEQQLAREPFDSAAAVTLADALMRQARVTGNAGLALRAEEALMKVLANEAGDYDARRMLGTVYLSQHRFREAVQSAERTSRMRPKDAWNYGVMGDGHLELGEYAEGFAALQTMARLRPGPPAYARAAYALELQGDLERALATMKMSAEATSAHDPESQAWHYAQVGNLYFQLGRLAEAQREYERAEFTFPGHPFAVAGRVRVKIARGDLAGARDLSAAEISRTPTPDLAAELGDLNIQLGDRAAAERYYVMAETAWRFDAPQPALLARFLAERGRNLDEAIVLAEQASAGRHDIFTEDALAWAYFKAGRTRDAVTAAKQALRTGTRDRQILYHAAAIMNAAGEREAARRLAVRSLEGNPHFDLISAPAAAELLRSIDGEVRIARR